MCKGIETLGLLQPTVFKTVSSTIRTHTIFPVLLKKGRNTIKFPRGHMGGIAGGAPPRHRGGTGTPAPYPLQRITAAKKLRGAQHPTIGTGPALSMCYAASSFGSMRQTVICRIDLFLDVVENLCSIQYLVIIPFLTDNFGITPGIFDTYSGFCPSVADFSALIRASRLRIISRSLPVITEAVTSLLSVGLSPAESRTSWKQ